MAASPSSSASPALGGDGSSISQALWTFRVPLYITHKTLQDSNSCPFITAVPRFSYLAQLLPRLSSFFGVPCSSFHHQGIQLRNLPVGLLVDLYQPSLPWRLEIGDGDEWDIGDTFLNGVKEVSFLLPMLYGLVWNQACPSSSNEHLLIIWPYSRVNRTTRPTLSETAMRSKL